jgi:hypothetical protein
MQTFYVSITGIQPLLMHSDDIDWSDQMEAWKSDKDNKKMSKPGDDRTPAFRWIGSLYRNDERQIVIPTENIMRALMEGGAMVPVPGGGKKTFKSQSQSGIMPRALSWPLLINGKVPDGKSIETIDGLLKEKDFKKHQAKVESLGLFDLFIKRARIGASKHIRVRPRFYKWATGGELVVQDEQITASVLQDILHMAGTYKGLCDWRPGAKTPGTYGTFMAEIKLL